jgi:Protein of unknown function (DUF2950)
MTDHRRLHRPATGVPRAVALLAAMARAVPHAPIARVERPVANQCLHQVADNPSKEAVAGEADDPRAVADAVDVDKGNAMNTIKTANMIQVIDQLSRFTSAFCGFALLVLLSTPLPGIAAEQKTFAAPEDAVGALIEAFKGDENEALIALFGEKHKRLFVSPDPAENAVWRASSLAKLQAFHLLEQNSPDRFTLLVGEDAWPMPIPLLRENGVWRFATELGEDEIITRRIGANERNAIKVLLAYLNAQRQYAAADRNGDEVLEYAQKLGSSPGKRDGLYWPADPDKGEEVSPFGPLIAASADHLKGHKAGDPFHGYRFRILTRQGKNAAGGAFNYLINGRMIAGFAMIAYPAEYGIDGVMTFMISNSGQIFEKDLGPETPTIANKIKEFNPGASWNKLKIAP